MNEETVRYDDLPLDTRLGLIGKPITLGIYTRNRTENEDVEGDEIGYVTGTLQRIMEDARNGTIEFLFEGSLQPAKWSQDEFTALVTWLADDI